MSEEEKNDDTILAEAAVPSLEIGESLDFQKVKSLEINETQVINFAKDESELSKNPEAMDISHQVAHPPEINISPPPLPSYGFDNEDVVSDKLTFRNLKFEDLESYKQLLKEFPHGFIGILFKEICDNEKGEFYAHGAFVDEKMIGMIIGIRDYAQIRQFTDIEAGLAAMTSKKLSHIVTIIVDPKFRRNEIGTKLLNRFMNFAGNNTAKFLFIPHKDINAQQFFEKQHFGALSTLRKFYNEFDDALLFVDKDSNRN